MNSMVKTIAFGGTALFLALLTGYFASRFPPSQMIWGGVALALFALSFLNIEFGLYILIFSMLLSPEIIVGGTAGASLGRGVTLRLEDFLLAVIGFSWFAKNAVNKELGLFLRTPLNRPMFLYAVACLLATGFGIMAGRVDPKTGFFFVLKYIEYYIVFFMLVNHVKSTAQIKRFVFCLLLTCFITAVIGIAQIPGGGRVSAPFEGRSGEPNTFGGYLVFMAAVAAGMLSQAERTRTRHLLTGLLLVILPPFLYVQSRSSYLAFVPAIFTLGYLLEKRVIVIGATVVGLMLSPLFLPTVVTDRILFTVRQEEQKGQIAIGDMRLDTSTSARVKSWQDAAAAWTRLPLLGYGVTGFRFVDAQFPRVLVETGVIGLAAFIYLLYAVFKLALTNLKRVNAAYSRGIIIGFLAGYVGLLFHAIGANTFIIVRIMEPFWFFAGIVAVLPAMETGDTTTAQTATRQCVSAIQIDRRLNSS
jgi:hypothetical protein